MRQLQHGDVLLQEITSLPEGVSRVKRSGDLIVAQGEATGHHHTISDKPAELWELNGELYLEATTPVIITHEEHKPMVIPTGTYKVGIVKEYDYFHEMERRVVD